MVITRSVAYQRVKSDMGESECSWLTSIMAEKSCNNQLYRQPQRGALRAATRLSRIAPLHHRASAYRAAGHEQA
jgi:hypothetical protein